MTKFIQQEKLFIIVMHHYSNISINIFYKIKKDMYGQNRIYVYYATIE